MNSISLITIFFMSFFGLSGKFQLALSSSTESVVDREGKPLIPGAEYFVLPAEGGGGLIYRKTSNSTCSTTVLHLKLQGSLGQLIRFTNTNGPIFTGTPIDIEFVEKLNCVKSSKWRVFSENDNKTTTFVGIGNEEDYPMNKIENGLFRILRQNKNYKFVFCHSGPSYNCTDIGENNDTKIVDAHLLKLFPSKPLEVTFLKYANV